MFQSIDTETTGVDLSHGAMPFIVTSADEDGNVSYWEADVNPLNRKPLWSRNDIEEIKAHINSIPKLVLQNPKFDVKALHTIDKSISANWRWEDTEDTLLMSHILASNQPHDLTSLVLIYLGVNIAPYEDEMEEHIKEARSLAKSDFPDWRIAKAGDSQMPSAKEKVWKFDMWLPRAIAQEKGYSEDHPWWTCASNYANADSIVTVQVYKRMFEILRTRKLEAIYRFRLQLLPVIYKMEARGVHASWPRTSSLQERLEAESQECQSKCMELADHEISKLPINGTSNDLKKVVFGKFKLVSSKKTPNGEPSMDKFVLDHWLATLPPESKPYKFIDNLKKYRKRQTSLGYIKSYKKFWLPTKLLQTMVLFPSFNPTGTDTLRFSAYNPNAQQISKQEEVNLRYCFGPAPGREWWSLDAKNIELRLPAYESGEEELISLFERPDDPPYYGSTHLLNFHTVYPDLWDKAVDEVGDDKAGPHCKKAYASTWYQWCKNGGFAIQYGAVNITEPNKWGTADIAFHKKGAHSLLEARFSKLRKLNQEQIDFANKYGYVETMPDKTVDPKRGYPLLCTRSNWGRVLETVPLSYHIQGTAMWWMCKAMVRVQEYLDFLNSSSTKGYFMVMQVHDELVFDFPKGSGPDPWKTNRAKIRKIQKIMEEGGVDIGIPTPVGVEYHDESWAKGQSV